MDSKNLQLLSAAGLLPAENQVSDAERAAIDSLSQAEVQALVNAKEKLGRDFFSPHAVHGLLF
jgi:hypothetical protein